MARGKKTFPGCMTIVNTALHPTAYTSLKPFTEFFAIGRPMLVYHKIGVRPKKVRIKGLYLSTRLFERQMDELQTAGYSTPPYGQLPARANSAKNITLSFDDGFESAFKHALEPLARHGFRAIQFLVADRIGQFNEWEVLQGEAREPLMDESQVRDWAGAGHEIGAHSLTHPYLTRISLREAREQVFSCKKKLEDRFGALIRHFCYPYGDWNPAVRDLVIEAGYETACTIDFGVNTAATAPFELRRITARYQSVSIKALKARIGQFMADKIPA
jgi:peptidoglycan/xylan/chitin deacetylase (PgdA/CDA1 family)